MPVDANEMRTRPSAGTSSVTGAAETSAVARIGRRPATATPTRYEPSGGSATGRAKETRLPTSPAPRPTLAHDATARPSSVRAPARSPAAIAARMSVLRTGRPSSVNGGTTTTSKPHSSPSAARAAGVPRARGRTPRRASSGSPPARPARGSARRTRRTASSAGPRRSAGRPSTSTPAVASRSSRSAGSHRSGGAAPTRISSGWWSNVMTAGCARRAAAASRRGARAGRRGRDGGRRRRRRRRRAGRVGRERVEPSTTSHRRDVSRPAADRAPGRRSGVDEDLVGCEPAARRQCAIATSAPPASREPVVGRAGPRQAAPRPDELAAGDGRTRSRQRHDRAALEPRVDRPQERQRDPSGRSVGRGRRGRASSETASSSVNGPARGPGQRPEVGGVAERLAEVAGDAPGCTSRPSSRPRRSRSVGPDRRRPSRRRSSACDRDRPRRSSGVSPARATA